MRQRQPAAIAEVVDQSFLQQFQGRAGISVNETCQALGVRRDKVYDLIHKGEPDGLTASKIDGRTIVHVASIHRLLQRTRITTKPRIRRVRHGAVTHLAPAPLQRTTVKSLKPRVRRVPRDLLEGAT